MGQFSSYFLYQKFETRGSQEAIPVYPNVYSIDADGTREMAIKLDNDPECGYDPPTPPMYKWVNIPITQDYICDDCPEYQTRWVRTDETICSGTPTPTTKDYFRLVENNTNGGSIQLVGATGTYQYSINSGVTWINANSNTVIPTTYGQVTMFKGTLRPDENNQLAGIGTFKDVGGFMTSYGNTMSLLFGDNFEDKTSLEGIDYAFSRLLKGSHLVEAVNKLPATTLSSGCYYEMYADCGMEYTIPALSATTLSDGCYQRMFSGCTSLKSMPGLPATALTSSCYEGMFYGCRSLGGGMVRINLPATNLRNAYSCYAGMFGGCVSLRDENLANPLPATQLTRYCYQKMFADCTGLVNIPSNFIAATSPGDAAMRGMFAGCTSLKRAPDILCSYATDWCFVRMFQGCSSLNYIKCLVKNGTSGPSYMPYQDFEEWMDGVSSTGTFVTPSDASWYNGKHGIPTGWTRVDA